MQDRTDREAWEAAYRDAFRRLARERGWKPEHIESGWLDEWPKQAWFAGGADGATPTDAAAADVPAAEWEATNA